ncbi:MAG TPA: hypothetical protein DCY17_05615 [Clostridiales bacterium]|nr:hypothetical protein [Clostridiales bacterium]
MINFAEMNVRYRSKSKKCIRRRHAARAERLALSNRQSAESEFAEEGSQKVPKRALPGTLIRESYL